MLLLRYLHKINDENGFVNNKWQSYKLSKIEVRNKQAVNDLKCKSNEFELIKRAAISQIEKIEILNTFEVLKIFLYNNRFLQFHWKILNICVNKINGVKN